MTDALIGRVLGGTYAIERPLGQGGFGMVYAARHERTGKSYAVKVLRSDRAGASEDAKTRFRREAATLSALGHPGIIAIHDFASTEDGIDYLVMDLLAGEDLSIRLARVNKLALDDALALMKQLASALSVAHQRGIVHRDLKPANIFLVDVTGEGERAIILDFGLAKMLDEATEERVTATGVAMGTPQYMSPEQAMGVALDHRTDIYSLASIFYELVAGQPVFTAPTLSALLVKVLTAPAPLISIHVSVPGHVEEALDRALSKEPAHRFDSTLEFLAALEGRGETPSPDTRPGPALTPVPMTRALPASGPRVDIAPVPPGPETPHAWPVRATTENVHRPARGWLTKALFGFAGLLLLLGGAGAAWVLGGSEPETDPAAVVTSGPPAVPIPARSVAAEPAATEPGIPGDPSVDPPTTPPPADDGADDGALEAPPAVAHRSSPSAAPRRPRTSPAHPATSAAQALAPPASAPSPGASIAPTGPAGPAAAAEHPQVAAARAVAQAQYREQVADLDGQLRAMDAFLERLLSLRAMLGGMADGQRPPICDGRGARAMAAESELGWLVSQQQRIRDQVERLCQPFENLESTPARVRNDIDRLASTLDGAEHSALNRSISSNTPVEIADQIVAAVRDARTAVRGVADGNRPFPCDAEVFRRLRQLQNAGNRYSGAAAGRVVTLRDRICRGLGTDRSALRDSERRFRQLIDDLEGTVRHNHRTIRGVRDQFQAYLQ